MDELEKEIDIISEKVEANSDITLFIRSNELRKSVKEKKIDIANIETKIEKSKNDLKKNLFFNLFHKLI